METLRNKWYDEKRKIAIKELKKAREKWLIKEGYNEEQEYHHKKAHKVIRIRKM
jgi:hypothetical protein